MPLPDIICNVRHLAALARCYPRPPTPAIPLCRRTGPWSPTGSRIRRDARLGSPTGWYPLWTPAGVQVLDTLPDSRNRGRRQGPGRILRRPSTIAAGHLTQAPPHAPGGQAARCASAKCSSSAHSALRTRGARLARRTMGELASGRAMRYTPSDALSRL
jgi:hypothetical protein